MSMSIQVRRDNGAVIAALAGAGNPAMLQFLRDPLTADISDAEVLVLDELTTGTVATLTEAPIHHLVGVHRSVPDALSVDRDGRGCP